MADIRTSIIIDLAGNLQARARRYADSMRRFSTNSQRHLAGLRRVSNLAARDIGRIGNRYTALVAGTAVVGGGKFAIGLEDRLEALGIQASRSQEEIAKFKQELFNTSLDPEIRVDPSQILNAIDQIVEKRGDLELALDNIRNIGLAIRAARAEGVDIGSLTADVEEKFGVRESEAMLHIFDMLIKQGKAGSFTLKNFATQGERITAAYAATGRVGQGAVREMGAIIQMVKRGVGSAEEASTAFERMIATITQEKVKELQASGVQIWDQQAMDKGIKMARSIPDIIKDIIRKTGGDAEKLAQVFDVRALRALIPFAIEFQRTGDFESFDKFLSVMGDGKTIMEDSARAARTASAALTQIYTVMKRAADSALGEPIKDFADYLNSIDPSKLEKVFKWMARIGAVWATLWTGKKIFNYGRSLISTFKGVIPGKKPAGVAGGLLKGIPEGVQPVYVVNMPGGFAEKLKSRLGRNAASGAAGAAGAGAGAAKGKIMQHLVKFGKVAVPVALAGAGGYAAGTVIDRQLQKTEKGQSFRHEVGALIAATLARFGNDNARNAIETEMDSRDQGLQHQSTQHEKITEKEKVTTQQQEVGGTIHLVIDSEGRPRVNQLESNNPNVNLEVDVGRIMATAL